VFGKDAVLDDNAAALAWFDYTLKGKANEYASGAPVRLFVMGENRWRDEQEFPLARTRYTKYYLHSAKSPSTAAGDGTLVTEAPRREPPARFDYDPEQPVPTIGGRPCRRATPQPRPHHPPPHQPRAGRSLCSPPARPPPTARTGDRPP